MDSFENLPIADEMPYWKTGKSGVETWLDKTEKMIENVGGFVSSRMAGRVNGQEGVMFQFRIDGDEYRLVFPVLPTKSDNDKTAAMRQAATFIYHDTKARVNRLKIFGPKITFMDYLILPSGKTAAQSNDVNNALLFLTDGK